MLFVEKKTLEFGLNERSVSAIFSSSSPSSHSLSLVPLSGKHKKTHFYEVSIYQSMLFFLFFSLYVLTRVFNFLVPLYVGISFFNFNLVS